MSFFCVGGLGGSGTSLVAATLRDHNIHIGNTLNRSLDNLFFSLLFRRPSWFIEFPSNAVIVEAIDIYIRNMLCSTGEFDLPSDEAYVNSLIESEDTTLYSKEEWQSHIQTQLRENQRRSTTSSIWGWKEPNTHIYIDQLNHYNEKMKYIHVVRDGIYMMNSRNKNQLEMWKRKFNLENTIDSTISLAALRYWITANRQAIDYGIENLKNRFYLLDYDIFCKQTEQEAINLLSFLDAPINAETINQLVSKIKHKAIDPQFRSTIFKSLPQDLAKQYTDYIDLSDHVTANQQN